MSALKATLDFSERWTEHFLDPLISVIDKIQKRKT
jgi:hypothetical protein